MKRKIKFFEGKDGGKYLIRFRKEYNSYSVDVDLGRVGFGNFLDTLGYSSRDTASKAFQKCVKGDVSMGQRFIAYHENGDDDSVYESFVEKVIKVLKRKGELTDPLVIDHKLFMRADTAKSNQLHFSMTLDDFENPGTKKIFNARLAFISPVVKECREGTSDAGWFLAQKPDKFNFLSLDGEKIGFCDKMDYDESHWELPRQQTKASKIIRSLLLVGAINIDNGGNTVISCSNYTNLTRRYSDDDVAGRSMYISMETEQFKYYVDKVIERAYEIVAADFKPKTFDLKTTKDIDKIYGTPNTIYGAGTLGNSCMSLHNRSEYTCAKQSEFYNKLNDVKMLYALGKDKQLSGRALLWKGEYFDQETRKFHPFKFVDRFYGSEDFVSAGRVWAAENGYWWRQNQSADSITLINKDGKTTEMFKSNTTKLPFGEVNRQVPYFDTLKYFNVLSRSKNYATLQLSSFDTQNSSKMDGTHATIMVIKCSNCGLVIVKDNKANAYNPELSDHVEACTHCSSQFHNHRYLKNKDDVRLTFNGYGYKVMPVAVQDGRLVSVEINGKKVLFDAQDHNGMVEYFSKKAKKKKKKKTVKRASYHVGPRRSARLHYRNPETGRVFEEPVEAEIDLPIDPPMEQPVAAEPAPDTDTVQDGAVEEWGVF